jgi:hypothetical protein
MSWNLILQIEGCGSSRISSSCRRTSIFGLAAAARIAIVSLDTGADPATGQLEQEILSSASSRTFQQCATVRLQGCMAEAVPDCMHVLVLIVSPSACPLSPAVETLAADWLRSAPGHARVIPVVLAPANFALAVPVQRAVPTLAYCTFANWQSASQVAGLVLEAAMGRGRPAAFISYVRTEARQAADDLHDALGRHGYRVFLDRFAGTPGRAFPREIVEEMAEMGVVVALETPSLLQARWTRWEIALARLYGIGLIALNFAKAPPIPGIGLRHSITRPATAGLSGGILTAAVDFILANRPLAALRRRAMFQAIVDSAARSTGGGARLTVNAAQIIRNSAGSDTAVVLAAGRPGRLQDVRLLEQARQPPGTTAVLAGQHAHLPSESRSDLSWLAKTCSIDLSGRSDLYPRVRWLAR